MKSISSGAMAAIEAGEAIVTGAVEIFPAQPIIVPVVPTDTNAIVLTWWQKSYSGDTPPDQARMGLGFYDGSGVHLATNAWAPYRNPTTWTQYTLNASAPGGTVTLRVLQDHLGQAGAFNDSYIDDIVLTVGGVLTPLTNPGAESSDAGWIELTGNLYGGSITSHTGSTTNLVFASTDQHCVAYQDVTISVDPPADPPATPDPLRLWGGYGPITLDGEVYQGIGDRGFVQQTSGAIGGVAQGLTIGVSGIETAALALLDPAEIKGASVVIRRLIFASDGRTLLDHAVWDRGRGDTVSSDETVGGSAEISLAVESAARGLGHSGARQRSDSDQRLIASTDGYFKQTAYAGEKTLYWGGKKPAIGRSGWGIQLNQ